MKAIINSLKRTHWFLALVTLIPWLLFLVLPSCQKDEFEKDYVRNMPSMSCTGLPINGKPILYYGPETFKITSKAPVKETRTLSNLNFDSFDDNFILKVQNASHGKTKVEKIEIRINDILIVSSSDFRKKGNIISKPITLSANSTMEIKLKGDKRSFIVLWIEGTLKEEMTVTDVEGNVYKTVNIGTQVWMAENLKTITYNDGAGIPLVTDNTAWSNLTTPGYCWLFNDEASYKNLYGALYNWQAINTGKLCPVGWHVPSITEWMTLEDYLGGFYVAGGKMKETGTTHWLSPNIDATNASGFTGLPGGHRGIDGVFLSVGPYLNFLGECGYFLSSSEVVEIVYDDGTHPVSIVGLHNENGFLGSAGNPNKVGMSVRCIKDSN